VRRPLSRMQRLARSAVRFDAYCLHVHLETNLLAGWHSFLSARNARVNQVKSGTSVVSYEALGIVNENHRLRSIVVLRNADVLFWCANVASPTVAQIRSTML